MSARSGTDGGTGGPSWQMILLIQPRNKSKGSRKRHNVFKKKQQNSHQQEVIVYLYVDILKQLKIIFNR